MILAFFQTTTFGWLIFRVNSIAQLQDAIVALLRDWTVGVGDTDLVAKVITLALPLVVFEIYQRAVGREPWKVWGWDTRAAFLAACGVAVIALDPPIHAPFIYFQF
jgi:hypothetical protein